MRVIFDDRPEDSTDTADRSTHYAPLALPGLGDVAKPVQGLLWAGSSWTQRAPKQTEQSNSEADTETPLFDGKG